MQLPILNTIPQTRQVTDVFAGYNHNLVIGDGEFYDMENLTSDFYPVLSPRAGRGKYVDAACPLGMICKDGLCYVDGSELYINGSAVSGLALDPSTEKTLVSMGAYIIIFPDKKYVNTVNTTDHGSLEAVYTSTGNVSVSLTKIDGSVYDSPSAISVGKVAPSSPSDGTYWIDSSQAVHTLKRYSSASGLWVAVATTYIKLVSTGMGANFAVGDGVTISGIAGNTSDGQLAAIDGNYTVWSRDADSIVIVGLVDSVKEISVPVTVKRAVPDMDFIIESGNRLWGCRHGISNGKTVNEIYACKQGDFKNWNCFNGLSTDSYVASLGSDGDFTGAVLYLGYPLFFKEHCIHKIYGSIPSNFGIQTTECRGVRKGCAKSLALVNETLFYKSGSGICAFDGSLPVDVSAAFGGVAYDNAVGCGHGNKYYVSMKDGSGNYSLFVYDTRKGIWHREDALRVDAFCSCGDELYCIEHGKNAILTMLGSGDSDTAPVKWFAESGTMLIDYPDRKYLSSIVLKMSLDTQSRVSVFVSYDSSGVWEHVFSYTSASLRSFNLPIRPHRCDHMRIRIEGSGNAKIFSLVKTIMQGSDR